MSIEVKNLSFSYGEHEVLHDVSFSVAAGEYLSILGPNGVGKSTLFRCVLGLLRDYTGSVTVEGRDAKSLSIREAARLIAYIPQSSHPAFNYSVRDIVLMGTTSGLGTFATPKKEDVRRVDEALEKIGRPRLAERCGRRTCGGERQLALIARALVQRAPVLMLDEPTASLDFGNQLLVLNCARELAREGYTVIQTTHNPEHSYMFSDRILALRGGRVLTEGGPKEVLTPELMRELYGVEVEVSSLFGDRVRVCTPASVARGQ